MINFFSKIFSKKNEVKPFSMEELHDLHDRVSSLYTGKDLRLVYAVIAGNLVMVLKEFKKMHPEIVNECFKNLKEQVENEENY